MGLNQGGAGRTYLTISSGKIAKKVKKGEPGFEGSIPCSNKEGNRNWNEIRYTSVSGYLQDVKKRTTEYGEDLCLVVRDGSEVFELQMPYRSRYANGFFFAMPNIDVNKEITFTPWMKEVTNNQGKQVKKTMLYLKQGGDQNVDWFFTLENPNGMPDLKEYVIKGQTTYDDTDRMNFFEKHLNGEFLPRLKLRNPESSDVPRQSRQVVEDEDSQDLPF